MTRISDLSEIKDYFANSDEVFYFVSASNFNLISLHRWVKRWTNINFINCFDSNHPNILMPSDFASELLESIESINSFLLRLPEIKETIEANAKVVFLFFNEEIAQQCKELKIEIIMPSNDLREHIDNKITTTEIGNAAGVPSVPNALTKIDSFKTLMEVAEREQLGSDWVVQTAFGDSGKTTFFISNEEDYARFADQIECEDKVKIMQRIRCSGTAIEGCATRWGTYVGPLLSELIGHPELTPYQGGWCGNELYQDNFSEHIRKQASDLTEHLGNELYKRNYRGYFEVDYLIDLDNQKVYLGEINPRITGITALTNTSEFCENNIPLFLFHLLEYDQKVELNITPSTFNAHCLENGAVGIQSQVIYKYTQAALAIITGAPLTGVYKLVNKELKFVAAANDPSAAREADEVFILRIMEAEEYAYKGGDLAILFANQALKDETQNLNEQALTIIKALGKCFSFRDLTQEELDLVERYKMPSAKIKT